jgi:aspartate/methionine/tyrosine aminotransferase
MPSPIAFAVEQWMDRFENTPGILNVAETCASSISIDDLVRLSEDADTKPVLTSSKLTYGSIRGSSALRNSVAALHSGSDHTLTENNVIIAQGGISANFLVLYTLLGPTDHVICVYPTYQQLYSVPESFGADVSLWRLKEENGFIPDVAELEEMVKRNTKVRQLMSNCDIM